MFRLCPNYEITMTLGQRVRLTAQLRAVAALLSRHSSANVIIGAYYVRIWRNAQETPAVRRRPQLVRGATITSSSSSIVAATTPCWRHGRGLSANLVPSSSGGPMHPGPRPRTTICCPDCCRTTARSMCSRRTITRRIFSSSQNGSALRASGSNPSSPRGAWLSHPRHGVAAGAQSTHDPQSRV
jgi:hypothetical protein